MPNRIIKESICTSENVDQLTAFQETFFVRLMVNCDDFGRMDARTRIIASRLFPLKDIKPAVIEDALSALESADLIIIYTVDGKPFLQMKTWEKHQQVRAKKSKYPSPDEGVCNQMISNDIKCPRNPIQANTESNTNTKAKCEPKRFTPPTVDEVAAYCKERNNGIDAQHFIDYYESRNWFLSNGRKCADWKACVRTWEGNKFNSGGGKKVSAQQYEQRSYSGSESMDDVLNRLSGVKTGA